MTFFYHSRNEYNKSVKLDWVISHLTLIQLSDYSARWTLFFFKNWISLEWSNKNMPNSSVSSFLCLSFVVLTNKHRRWPGFFFFYLLPFFFFFFILRPSFLSHVSFSFSLSACHSRVSPRTWYASPVALCKDRLVKNPRPSKTWYSHFATYQTCLTSMSKWDNSLRKE